MNNISIIMGTYNTGSVLSRALDAALIQKGVKEIIVVNNGNPPEVVEELKKLERNHKKIKLISGHGNVGFARGCNIGAKEATGEYILLLNPDCFLLTDSLIALIEEFKKYPEAWMVGCRLTQPDGSIHGGNKRNLLTLKIALSHAFHLYKIDSDKFPCVNLLESKDEDTSYVPAISGAFMLMKTKRYIDIGGIDDEYFFHVEDLDFCRYIHELGGKILYVPKIKAIHYLSSSRITSYFIEKHKTKGFHRYFYKHYKEKMLLPIYTLMIIAIYCRLYIKIPFFIINNYLEKAKLNSLIKKEKRQLDFLKLEYSDKYKNINEFNKNLKNFEPVIVAGATGQVGLSILKRLLTNNIKTIGLFHNQIIDYRNDNLKWVQGDIASGYFSFSNEKPKTLIHTPAIWLLAPQLEKFAEMGIKRIICFSSTSIDGKAKSSNVYEKKSVQKFISSEKEVAQKCKELGIDFTIFRPTMIYGTGLDRNVSSIINFINKFGFFPVSYPANGLRQPVHNDDLAIAILKSINNENSYGETYVLSGKTELTYYDMVNKISSTLNKGNRATKIPFLPQIINLLTIFSSNEEINGEIAKRMNQNLVFSYKEASKDFDYSPREFLDGGMADLGISEK